LETSRFQKEESTMLFPWLRNKDSRQSRRSMGRKRLARGAPQSFKPALESLEDRMLLSAGSLDPTFGVGGVVQTGLAYHVSDVNSTGFKSLAIQPLDGKFLVAGASNGATPGFTVARFNGDGSPDTAFGTNGVASVQFSANSVDRATAVALEANGQIIVEGTTTDAAGNGNIGVTRFNPDGSLDTTFGFNQNGRVIIDFTPPGTAHVNTLGSTVAIEADGRIVVGGTTGPYPTQPSGVPVTDWAVARLNADGTQDADFDADGRILMNVGATISGGVFSTTDNLSDIGIEPDGKIVAVGWTNIQNDGKAVDLSDNFGVARFNPDGTLDRTFQTGVVSYDLSNSPYGIKGPSPFLDRAYSVAFDLKGDILVSGTSQYETAGPGGFGNPTQDNFATIRLTPSGAFDNTFTADGVVITDFAPDFSLGSEDQASHVIPQADGKIIVVGFTTTTSVIPGPTPTPNANNKNFAMARYNADGTLDQTFGFHGKVITDIGGGTSDYANQAVVLNNGQIVLAGGIGDNPNAKLAFVRYTGFLPGTVQFSSGNYSVNENGGSVTITVTRVGGTDGTASVQYSTTSGTAVPGTDFTPATGTLTFPPSVTTATFSVNVRDDGVFQATNKTFNVTLTNLFGGPSFGTPVTATVTMIEQDVPGQNINPGPTPTPATANQKYVKQVYLDLLGRPADPSGLASWSAFLDGGGSRLTFTQMMTSSTEYRADVVNALYLKYLHRAADQGGLNGFVNLLASGGTDEQVAAALIGSQEYFQTRGGGTFNGFITAMYADALNRAPDAAGQAGFLNLLQNGFTTGQVAAILLGSVEYDADLVQGWYIQFLRRPADAGGLNSFVNLLQNGTHPGQQPIFISDPTGAVHRVRDEDIIDMLLSSDEYYAFTQR
jgi:uncharacterized delta-60 repeat protein